MKKPPEGGFFIEAENNQASASAQMFFAQFIA